jgi:NADH-quinone oxidoreductase subunit M
MNIHPVIAVTASIAIVLAPAYAIWFYHRVTSGSFSTYLPTLLEEVKELNLLLPLLFFTFLFGIYPKLILEPLHLSCLSLILL